MTLNDFVRKYANKPISEDLDQYLSRYLNQGTLGNIGQQPLIGEPKEGGVVRRKVFCLEPTTDFLNTIPPRVKKTVRGYLYSFPRMSRSQSPTWALQSTQKMS